MKRLISILVLVAMMLTSFAGTISALADEIVGDGNVVEGDEAPANVYNVNWEKLVGEGTMRSQWLYDRAPGQNNMAAKYNITATENALSLDREGGKSGDHRQYYSDVMFDITADTQYVYELEVKSVSPDGDGGFVFAFANNPNGRDEDDPKKDIYGTGVRDKVAAYVMNGKLNSGTAGLYFGGAWDNYGYVDNKNLKEALVNPKVSEDGYTNYKVVYTGLVVEVFYLNTADEWVELYTAETITLAEGAKLAFGIYAWGTDWANIRNCVITAGNDAAIAAIAAATSVDKTAYNEKIAEADALVQADWFIADWDKFATVITAAKAEANAAKYQYQIDLITEKVAKAVTTLKVTASAIKPAVEALIAEVDALVENEALYTEASWGKVKTALEAAKAAVADEATAQSAFVSAYYALLNAKKGLLTKELAAKNVYNVNWKLLFDNNMLRSQWWWENTDNQNNYLSLYKVTATDTLLGSEPIGDGDNRAYYSTNMIEITDYTYYEYTFEAKNDRAGGYAGIMFAYDTNNFPYFVYGQFDNSSDNGTSADFRYRKGHQDRNTDGHNSAISSDRHYPVLDLTAEGFGQFKYVYDGYNFSFYAMTEGELKLIWTYTLPQGSKIAVGVYTRGGKLSERRTMTLQNCVVTAYNDAATEVLFDAMTAYLYDIANAKLAENYTPATEQAVKDAMAAVKAINAETTYEDANAKIDALVAAILGLRNADKTALIAAIEAANAAIADKTAADFEEKYYTPFAAALEAAKAANDNVEATQEVVDAACAELVKTTKYLTPAGAACVVDLDDVLALYATLVENDYKPSSWATLAAPLAVAENLKASELTNADQEAVDAAVVALNDAIAALVKRANFNALNSIINRANALDKTDYTADSWNIEGVLAEAIAASLNFELDQADVDAAHKALNDAINALVTWRTNVLAIVPGDDYEVNDKEKYPNPNEYNKITDMSYHGLGNVFYYDYHKVVAATKTNADLWANFTPGQAFPEGMHKLGWEGKADYVLRLGTNMSGSGTNRVTDGVKEGGTDLEHHGNYVNVNGKKYNHAFGFSFLKAPTVDSIAVYLPTNTKIVSIDVYGAVLTKNADGTILYGKADKDAVTEVDGAKYEDATTAKKIYLGTINVPAAEAGAANILAAGDLVQAMKVDYIYFALTMNDTFNNGSLYYIKEIELYGLNDGQTVDGKAAPDFSAVNAAVAAYYACVEADYTAESWANVSAVMAQYAGVINYIKADQADVDEAAAAIAAAVNALVAKPADWTALDEAITAGSAITEDAYTPITYAPFKEAYDAAVALRAATNVPQTAVNKALAALNAVLAAVEKRADFTELKANLEAAKLLKEEEWNANKLAWKMFTNAIAAAEELLANVNATQAEVDKVAGDLISRKADLTAVEKPEEPENNETEAPKETTAPQETEAPKATESSKATETEAPAAEEEGCGGCGSSAAISAIALVSVIGTAVVIKKKED